MSRKWTPAERAGLIALALFGFGIVNGAFVYGLLYQPNAMAEAMQNPIAAAFMVEAGVLVGVFAWLFERWRLSRLSWPWFVGLSLIGSMAFAVPVLLLFPRTEGDKSGAESTESA